MSTTNERVAKGMRWAARIIGLPVTLFGAMMAFGEGIQSIQTEGLGPINSALTWGGLFIALSMVIAVIGCVISWWKLRIAGILLVLTFLCLIAAGVLAGGPVDLPGRFSLSVILMNMGRASIMGSPFLIAGVLFIISWWLSQDALSHTQACSAR
jgi:hypothetical protein